MNNMQFGVNTVIIQDDKIALIRREDFEVWSLPGGQIDPGESYAEAAIREASEETGLEIQLTRLVGVYSLVGGWVAGSHILCFAAEVVGGTLRYQPEEAIDIGWFDPHDLPQPFMHRHTQRIMDTLNGVTGAVWKQQLASPQIQGLSRAELYQMRDESGLSRFEFYRQYVDGTELMLTNEVKGMQLRD